MPNQSDGIEVYEISEEEFAAIKAKLYARLYAIPQWWDKLAECHIACSDLDVPMNRLAHDLWFILSPDEVDELYAEAERIRNEQATAE